jgi:hypothetical protein
MCSLRTTDKRYSNRLQHAVAEKRPGLTWLDLFAYDALHVSHGTEGIAQLVSESVRFIATMAGMSWLEGPFGPGLPRRFGVNSNRYFGCTSAR